MKVKFLAKLLCLLLCLSLLGCTQNPSQSQEPSQTDGPDTVYTISIRTDAGQVPSGIRYYVYKSADRFGVAANGTLTTSGHISFVAPLKAEGYYLVLEGLEEGYEAQEMYQIKQADTQLVIATGLVMDKNPLEKTYYLGEMMRDAAFTDTDGQSYTISGLLEEKKAVVLNFWNITCSPCKAEFPYLQAAYEAYSDDIALLCLNDIDTDIAAIAAFKEQYGLTMPVCAVDFAWVQAMAKGNPTTVVIDRYGRIVFKHTAGIEGEGLFEALFAYVSAEDYEQQLISNLQEFAKEHPANP